MIFLADTISYERPSSCPPSFWYTNRHRWVRCSPKF